TGQPRRLERRVRDERLGEPGKRALEARDARYRAELRELPEELPALERLERILVLELRDHELQELLLAETAFVRLDPRVAACVLARRSDSRQHRRLPLTE